jgi:hypothetical protein
MVLSFTFAGVWAWLRINSGDGWRWGADMNFQLIAYGILSSGLLTYAILKIKRLAESQPELETSHKMMTTHLFIFNTYAFLMFFQQIMFSS